MSVDKLEVISSLYPRKSLVTAGVLIKLPLVSSILPSRTKHMYVHVVLSKSNFGGNSYKLEVVRGLLKRYLERRYHNYQVTVNLGHWDSYQASVDEWSVRQLAQQVFDLTGE